jgi:DNA primase
MDDGFAERVRTHTDIVEIISDYVTLKQQGRDLVGLCPFHEEKTPSFTVSPERQLYYCFGCHQGGDVFNFVMQIEGLTFPEALRFLAERAGIEVPRRMREGGSSRRQRVRDYLYRLGELAAEFYRERLEDSAGAAARNYLRDRGIPESVQKEYRLGYAPGSWNAMCGMLQSRGVKMRAAELMGLVKKSE